MVSGIIYTARDAAHKRICALIEKGEELPLPLKGQAIYYTGPTPAPEGFPIGACGPTTSGRMDAYAPRLIELGACGLNRQGGGAARRCALLR